MSINQRLELKQGQTLTMTPQLQQAIKLLQLSNLELSEYIEAELEKNPLLERADGPTLEPSPEEKPAEEDAPKEDIPETKNADTKEGANETDFDYSTAAYAGVGAGGNSKFDDLDGGFENTLAATVTLRDHLADQIKVDFTDNKDRAIALLMFDYIDEAGYFRAELQPLADRLGCDLSRVSGILDRLQHLDPPGIFARNLSECLALQLREKNRLDPAMEKLLAHLDLLAAHDLKKLKTVCGVDDEDLKEMIAEIKNLDPKPALHFDHFVSQTVVPDVLMKPLPKSKGGGWGIELNPDTLPRVLINKTYYAEVSKNAKNKQDKEYLNTQINSANWLVKALDQRAETILKVAGEIITQQEGFFNYGVEFLKPLVLKDVADAISMHESTVSRVTTSKYIGTPRGVFELKYFFTSGVSGTESGAEFSSEAVKARIKTLIDAETADNILSDDDLVLALQKDGVEIARRTVAKYREAMKIGSSVQRRRLKKSL